MSQALAEVWPLIEADIVRIRQSYAVPAPYAIEPRRPTGRQIIREVAQRHGLSLEEFLRYSRDRKVSWPRHEAIWEMRRKTKLSYHQIARLLNRQDHTTIIYGERAHAKRLAKT